MKKIIYLIKIEDIPKDVRKNPDDKEIHLIDKELTQKLRTELGWE